MPANSQSNTLPACAFRDVKRSFAIPSSPFGLVGIFQPTGFLTSTAFTAYSVRNAATGMVLYNDVFGNTVPGTDIKIAFSCDDGASYASGTIVDTVTQLSYHTTAFTDITMCPNAGNKIRYKVELFNQAEGSKVTQLRGFAMHW